jgi:hypothetical protein
MSQMTDYLEQRFLNHFLRNTASTAVSPYIGLYTASPTDTGSGATEISGSSYARQSMSFAVPDTTAGTTSTNADITFPQATGAWGTITHFGIYDAATAGNLLFWGAFTASKTIASGDVFKISSGNLTVTAA